MLGGERGGYLRMATFLFAFVALRARALPWFADVRSAATGRVRFVSSRVHPVTAAFVAFLASLGGFALLPLLQFPAVPLTVGLVLAWLVWSLSVAHVTVGKDGVQVTRWRDVFYPRTEATLATVDPSRLLLVQGSAARTLRFAPMTAAERRLLALRVEAHFVSPDDAPGRAEVSGEELAATLATLTSLDGATGYRVAEVPRETLWRIVEARSVAAPIRVRAAELVAAEPQEDDLPRLRRLAEDLAEPATSEAIARIAGR